MHDNGDNGGKGGVYQYSKHTHISKSLKQNVQEKIFDTKLY